LTTKNISVILDIWIKRKRLLRWLPLRSPPDFRPSNCLLVASLMACRLVMSERQSRSILYRADLNGLRAVTLYLLKDCCGGNANLCAPLIAELSPCCPPNERRQVAN